MGEERETGYDLIDIVRDPGVWIYEALELSVDGHYYIFRYDASEETFYRATVPAGAAAVHFHPLGPSGKVPISGWVPVERARLPRMGLQLVASRGMFSP